MDKNVRSERKGIQDGGVICNVVWFRDCGIEEMTGSRVGG